MKSWNKVDTPFVSKDIATDESLIVIAPHVYSTRSIDSTRYDDHININDWHENCWRVSDIGAFEIAQEFCQKQEISSFYTNYYSRAELDLNRDIGSGKRQFKTTLVGDLAIDPTVHKKHHQALKKNWIQSRLDLSEKLDYIPQPTLIMIHTYDTYCTTTQIKRPEIGILTGGLEALRNESLPDYCNWMPSEIGRRFVSTDLIWRMLKEFGNNSYSCEIQYPYGGFPMHQTIEPRIIASQWYKFLLRKFDEDYNFLYQDDLMSIRNIIIKNSLISSNLITKSIDTGYFGYLLKKIDTYLNENISNLVSAYFDSPEKVEIIFIEARRDLVVQNENKKLKDRKNINKVAHILSNVVDDYLFYKTTKKNTKKTV